MARGVRQTPEGGQMNTLEIRDQKREIRKEVREKVRKISEKNVLNFSHAAAELLLQQEQWSSARQLLGYLALKDEIELSAVLKAAFNSGKTVALPRFIPETGLYGAAVLPEKEGFATLSFGRFGVLEPAGTAPILPLNQLDVVRVPGVAFDPSGRRLGRGEWGYDRILAIRSTARTKCVV